MRITQIRHVLVLESADPNTPLIRAVPDINLKSQEKIWEIKKILDTNLINNN